MRSSSYTVELLAPLVRESRSFGELLAKLGLRNNGGNHRMITARIRYLELDISHFARQVSYRAVCAALDRERLAPIVARSSSMAQVLTALEMPTEGRSHHELRRRLRELRISTAHFRGQAWARGETRATHPSVERASRINSFPNEVAFAENSPLYSGQRISSRLRALGWPYRCALCGISEWRDAPLVLHLDHINGTHNDNRLENLRWLCPNCHSQTPTYCNRARELGAPCYTTCPQASVAEWQTLQP